MTTRLRALLLALAIALLSTTAAGAEWRSPTLGPPWQPRLWVPAPMDFAARLYVLDSARFARAVRLYGLPPGTAAFAIWRPRLCWIFITPRSLSLVTEELRHCQQGHYHH